MVECVNCAKFKGCNFSNPYLHECVDYQETQTNDEWRRTCSTEEFARFLEDVTDGCYHCGMTNDISLCAFQKHRCNIKEWLKQPHTKE